MSSFNKFLHWYRNKDIVPPLTARQKLIAFHDDNDIVVLELGCTSPIMADICLHKPTIAKLYPFAEGDKKTFWKNFGKLLLVVHLT